jgi:hypothetical protein
MPACAGTNAKWEREIRKFKTFKPFNRFAPFKASNFEIRSSKSETIQTSKLYCESISLLRDLRSYGLNCLNVLN